MPFCLRSEMPADLVILILLFLISLLAGIIVFLIIRLSSYRNIVRDADYMPEFEVLKDMRNAICVFDRNRNLVFSNHSFDILCNDIPDFSEKLYEKISAEYAQHTMLCITGDTEMYFLKDSFVFIKEDGGKFFKVVVLTDFTETAIRINTIDSRYTELSEKIRQISDELSSALIEREKVEEELNLSLQRLKEDEEAGKKLQTKMLPRSFEDIGDYSFYHLLMPSMYLSGDFVDYFSIDERYTGFYLADISGHGTSSGFVTVWLKAFVENNLANHRAQNDGIILSPARLLGKMNYSIKYEKLGKHLTVFYGVIDNKDKTMLWSNAGQFPFPVVYNGEEPYFLEEKNLPIGLLDNIDYPEYLLKLKKGFFLMAVSDGIFEILQDMNIHEKEDYLISLADRSGFDLNGLIYRSGLESLSTLPDDITFLMIREKYE